MSYLPNNPLSPLVAPPVAPVTVEPSDCMSWLLPVLAASLVMAPSTSLATSPAVAALLL